MESPPSPEAAHPEKNYRFKARKTERTVYNNRNLPIRDVNYQKYYEKVKVPKSKLQFDPCAEYDLLD